MNNREKGSRYEDAAASFFEQQGFKVLEKNYRRKTGEIDLIALDNGVIVFTEVKYRKTLKNGYPEEAVNRKKQERIFRTAEWYLKEHRLSFAHPCRFDVLSITDGSIRHIRNAFGGM